MITLTRFLDRLTPEQEDRLLTQEFSSGPYTQCMVGVACGLDRARALAMSHSTFLHWQNTYDPVLYVPSYNIHRWSGNRAGTHYDYLCFRFGSKRVNQAIRLRILRNRLRRLPQPVPQELVAV